MMDSDGRVVEGTQTNFFALHVRSCAVGCAFGRVSNARIGRVGKW